MKVFLWMSKMKGSWEFTDLATFFTGLPVGIFIGGGLFALGIIFCIVSSFVVCSKRKCSSKSKKIDTEMGFDNAGYGMKQGNKPHREMPLSVNPSLPLEIEHTDNQSHIQDDEDFPDYENTPDKIKLVKGKDKKLMQTQQVVSVTANIASRPDVQHIDNQSNFEDDDDLPDYENTPDKVQLLTDKDANLDQRQVLFKNSNENNQMGKSSLGTIGDQSNDDYENTPEKIRSYTLERNKDIDQFGKQADVKPSSDVAGNTVVRKSVHDYDEIGDEENNASDHIYEDADRYDDDVAEDYENVKQLTLDRRNEKS